MKKIIVLISSIFIVSLFSFCENLSSVKKMDLSGTWTFKQINQSVWKNARVPGVVHMDLLSNKLIDDPFFGTNEKDLQWIGREDWEYQREFLVSAELLKNKTIILCFEGLDTFSEVYLNEKKILESGNMFRIYQVNVKNYLLAGKNKIRVKFFSPLKMGKREYKKYQFHYPASNDQATRFGEEKVSPFTRKAPYHYGWDWGPRFLTMGIYRPVSLIFYDQFKIDDVYIVQEHIDKTKVNLKIQSVLFSNVACETELSVKLGKKIILTKNIQLQKGVNKKRLKITIDNPQLWWPNGYGKQHLYEVGIHIKNSLGEDNFKRNIGLRTVELVREKEGRDKESFYFKINGIPVYMKGANYIPNDSFLTRVDRNDYNNILEFAVDAKMNMLRVWGGGVYERDCFYELCDKKGILIWQDFMFACSMYPANDRFIKNISAEARDNIIRLRNHPCLALWCGNNEIEGAWNHWGWQETIKKQGTDSAVRQLSHEYEKIFHQVLPKLVKQLDPQTSYWPSSPAMDMDVKTPDTSLLKGDYHYWGVWHGEKPFSDFKMNVPRFMSEFGFQSFPGIKTIKSFARQNELDIESEVMKFHQRHPRGNKLIKKYLQMGMFVPEKFEDFLYMSQLLAGKGMQVGIEAQRGAKPYCMGTLYWQLNDCWPVASWSGVDYFQRPKALHYFVKRAYQEILILADVEKTNLTIRVVSDRFSDFTGKIRIRLVDFSNQILFKKEIEQTIVKNTAKEYLSIPLTEIVKDYHRDRIVLVAEVIENDKLLSRDFNYFSDEKELKLFEASLKMKTIETSRGYQMEIESSTFVKDLYLNSKTVNGYFTDNFFNLLPQEKKTIEFITSDKTTPFTSQIDFLHFKDVQQRND